MSTPPCPGIRLIHAHLSPRLSQLSIEQAPIKQMPVGQARQMPPASPVYPTVGFPNACELNSLSHDKVLVWNRDEHGQSIDKTWSQHQLFFEAKKNSGFRVSRLPINGKGLVEIYQRDIFPPEEQAAYAHYPNQGNGLASVSLGPVDRYQKYLYIISKRWRTWECCKCSFRNKYELEAFEEDECAECKQNGCMKCLIESIEG
ncbi:hypothetical protein NA57DRAFT_69930 [Rhizodiscina lignyota]|uniref:Uncharacterized protein n=1 Tax=Rhizodiscina lignyota TaxID=1504668 RepID=A0A9P4MAX4_9PEZI|nr:hypothetical protein NA57DRAFT_69930 [Rhizodiscina lignyota]